MLQTLKSRRNRKGFTLAELLIVVAIIAVLVAIAVPLFVGALNNAEDRVKDANIRAVRGLAVEEILMNWEDYKTAEKPAPSEGGGSPTQEPAAAWYAYAVVSANGDVTKLTIAATYAEDTIPAKITALTKLTIDTDKSGKCEKAADGKTYDVLVKMTELEVS